MSFKNILFYIILVICYLVPSQVFSWQNSPKEKQVAIQRIDSLINKYNTINDYDDIKGYRDLVNRSKHIAYKKGLNWGYTFIAYHHGEARQLDSVTFYLNKLYNLYPSITDPSTKFDNIFARTEILRFDLGIETGIIQLYEEALMLAPKTDDPIVNDVAISLNLAHLYIVKSDLDKALDLLTAKTKYEDVIDKEYSFNLYYYLAGVYDDLNQYEKRSATNEKLLQLAYDKGSYLIVKDNITRDYYAKKEYQRAIDSALIIRPQIRLHTPLTLSNNAYNIAKYYEALGNYEKAIQYTKEAITTEEEYNYLPKYYKILSLYYDKTGNNELALENKKKEIKIRDSIQKTDKKIALSQLHQELVSTAKENDKKGRWILIAVCFALLVVAITVYIIKKLNKRKIARQNSFLKGKIQEKDQEVTALLFEEKKRIEKLVSINDELVGKLTENGAPGSNIKHVKREVASITNDKIRVAKDILEDDFFLHQLKQKHPELTTTDLKHCLYVLLGKSLKETAKVLHVSPDTVKSARRRVTHKIIGKGASRTTNSSLKDYLLDFKTSLL